jgi:threonyl-tRNA synthetase
MRAEKGLVSALDKMNLEYTRKQGEAVFYGPKIDIKLLDALGREWQATTIQFDFNLPKRFKIEYMDKDGQHKEVVAIHRAIYGSLERFIGCLIEHYKGAFPLWLSPVQVELNDKSEKMNYRIREAEVQKAPYIIIVGKREVDNTTVSVRKHGKGDIGIMKLKDFLNLIKKDLGGND